MLILKADNWLQPRPSGIWKTDASSNLLHMHGIEFLSYYKQYANYLFNGFAGDLVLGGSYLRKAFLDKEICPSIIQENTGTKKTIDPNNEWYKISKIDPYFINNRVRRFTNTGLIILRSTVEVLIPFFDNALIEFVYSFPDALRYKSHIYKKMLLIAYPEYYKGLPWQKTGYPISYPDAFIKTITFKNRVVERLKREAGRFGIKYKNIHGYTDYAEWLRKEPAKSFLKSVLSARNAIYPAYIDQSKVKEHLEDNLQNKANHSDKLCAALTFEIWLQQIFEGRYRE
jgi:asparagine synthase (glutamine-hydrolysing)